MTATPKGYQPLDAARSRRGRRHVGGDHSRVRRGRGASRRTDGGAPERAGDGNAGSPHGALGGHVRSRRAGGRGAGTVGDIATAPAHGLPVGAGRR
jgi:hypothetical protein